MRARVGVKAILLHEQRLVTIEKHEAAGAYYSFPGGGQHGGETLAQAAAREVVEETGWHVTVGNLLCVREYIGRNHEFAAEDAQVHVVDHLFLCSLLDPTAPPQPVDPDRDQTGVVWLPVAHLSTYRFYPRTLIPHLIQLSETGVWGGTGYVGDVN